MKLTITKETTEEVEVPVPSFYSTKFQVLGILNDKTVFRAYQNEGLTIIQSSTIDIAKQDILKSINTGVPLSEGAFFEAYNAILQSISLTPTLKP